MARDAAATRARIIEAATTEFATHGLAGARVDRLAGNADANKERIYAYFGSKEGLFDATVEANIEQLLDAVAFTATDLPGYAVALFDFSMAHPQFVRLALWHTLERPGVLARLEQSAASTGRKLAALADAQQAGLVMDDLPAWTLLEHVLGLVNGVLILPFSTEPEDLPDRRAAIRIAMERLTRPARSN